MSISIIELQRQIFLHALNTAASDDRDDDKWKVLVCDKDSRILLDNVTTKDEVLNCNVIDIEQLEDRRETQSETKAVYLLSPLPHIIDWLQADLNRRRYKEAYIIWTSQPRRDLVAGLRRSEAGARAQDRSTSLNIDFYSKESHVITFRDPESFQILFNPRCDSLIRSHLDNLTRSIVSICVSLGEYPVVRYYRPKNPIHDAAVLCTHLAKFVQDALDEYARNARDFPPPSSRPRATLLITDRSMDLMSPLVHELTYQAMAMDLLPMQGKDDKISYRNIIRRGEPDQEEKDTELNDRDKIWVENRHLHMKDLLVKLSDDFKKFQAKNPQFSNTSGQNISVNTIKDMLAGLPEFQEGKEAFSLHIDMAEKCAKSFQDQKLLDITSLEQSLATKRDEDGQTPKNVTDQLVRLLDEEFTTPESRARLLMMYIIYRGGILDADITKLLNHGELANTDTYLHIINNMQNLGARVKRRLGNNENEYKPIFEAKDVTYAQGEEVSLSRFEPQLKYALEALCHGSLDNMQFPAVKPHLDDPNGQPNQTQTSLRSAGKPTWASSRPSANKPRQRIIVFMAGGATYAESRSCYEISQQMGKEVFLSSTHMMTPKVYFHQLADLSLSPRELNLSMNKAPSQVPSWLNDAPPGSMRPQQPAPSKSGLPSNVRPPTEAMQNMNLGPQRPSNGSSRPASSQAATSQTSAGSFSSQLDHSSGKLKKEKKEKGRLGGLFKKH